jgi:hypothetical protein
MIQFRTLLGVGFSLFLIGCVLFIPKETSYLRSAQDRATQNDVKRELGSPSLAVATRAGESVWVYQVREEQSGSRMTASGLWCDEYVLVFDGRGMLRSWTHQSQFHGGEMAPKYCVPSDYQSKS